MNSELAEKLFNFKKSNTYPRYKLVDGGENVLIELSENKFKSYKVHHIMELGVLCDDLETFIKWEDFSK